MESSRMQILGTWPIKSLTLLKSVDYRNQVDLNPSAIPRCEAARHQPRPSLRFFIAAQHHGWLSDSLLIPLCDDQPQHPPGNRPIDSTRGTCHDWGRPQVHLSPPLTMSTRPAALSVKRPIRSGPPSSLTTNEPFANMHGAGPSTAAR